MSKYRIDASFEMIGAFWKFGQQSDLFTGTLRARRGQVHVLAAPSYTLNLDGDALRVAIMQMLNGRRDLNRIPSICGFTTDNLCTLLDSIVLDGGGNINFQTGQSISGEAYTPTRVVMGLHVESADALCIEQGAFYLSKVHHILPTPWKSEGSIDNLSYHAFRGATEVFRFISVGIDAEVICEVFADDGSKLKKEASMKALPRIRIIPRTPRSIEWFIKLAFRAENFFTLLLGTSVGIKRIQLTQGGDSGWIVQKMKRRTEKVDSQMLIRCSADEMAGAFAKWMSVPVDKQPVELVVLGMMRKSKVFAETEFLSFAQALEGFGRMRCGSGKKRSVTVKTLIEKTYDLISPELAGQLLGECSKFTKKFIQTRDYYTHLGNDIGRDGAKNAKELFYLNKSLQAFLRCVMLVDLGIAEKHLTVPILYQANKWKVG